MAIGRDLERINGVMKKEDINFLKALAHREGITFSRFIRKILEEYLETQEDLFLVELAESRKRSGGRFLSAEQLIKELNRPRGK